jgi:putative protease
MGMIQKTLKPELLAPAGDLQAGLTAFECGADAVYAGLQRFNARERNENFSTDDLGTLILAARQRKRKVYVTLNTLIREPEIADVVEMLAELDRLRPDAVIVQDLGVLRMIRCDFPNLKIHASTQMGSHNSAAVNWLARQGVERVILQRQIPVDELREIVRSSQIEVEAFVHGALCCCLSGACLFSSWMGGWSGNRGKCKQPCRRRYFSEEGNGFFFSTNDLYGLDVLDDLEDAGVASLKIEGRLRKADYVEHVVKAYRMMLDTPREDRRARLGEARAELSRALGRKWSHGYLIRDEWKDVLSPESPGVSGMLCGKVRRVKPSGFSFNASRRVHFGDRIRIQSPQGDDGPALTVTMMHVNGCEVKTVRRGEVAEIRYDRSAEVPEDGLVYRIGVASGGRKELEVELPVVPAQTVDFTVIIHEKGFRAEVPGMGVWERDESIPLAKKRAVTAGLVEEEFRKSLMDDLAAGNVQVEIEGDRFVNQRGLRHARQEFWDWVKERIDVVTVRSPKGAQAFGPQLADADLRAPFIEPLGEPITTTVRLPKGAQASSPQLAAGNDRPILVARDIWDVDEENPADEVVLPDFCPEPRLPALRERVSALVGQGFLRWRATSIYGLELLHPFEGLSVTAAFLLPVANSLALAELVECGVARAMAWPELDRNALEALALRSADRLEAFAYGRPPLLNTRIELPVQGEITDARGNVFQIEKDGGLWRVFPEDVMELDNLPEGVGRFIDLTHARLNEPSARNFNLDRDFA